jgi:hypothetical protein
MTRVAGTTGRARLIGAALGVGLLAVTTIVWLGRWPGTAVDDGARPRPPLPCEQFGYPCRWRDGDPRVITDMIALLRSAGRDLGGGTSPAAVAARLDADPRVAGTNAEPYGVMFRLDGGLPVVALTEVDGAGDGAIWRLL